MLLNIVIAFIAILHLGFMLLEMFLWTKPVGLRIFAMTPERAEMTRTLAANQGLYNGFLAAGLFWSVLSGDASLQLFFLCCVFTAGVFGALSVSRSIFWVQGFPSLLALLLFFWS